MPKIVQIESYIAYQKNTYKSDLLLFSTWFQKINHEEIKLNKITLMDLRQ